MPQDNPFPPCRGGSLTRIGDSDKTGTTVRFFADSSIFETLEYEYEVLENRLREVAFLTKGLHIVIEDLREETPKKGDFCYEGGLVSFVEYLNKNKEKLHPKPIAIEKDGEYPVEIAIQYTTNYDFMLALAQGRLLNGDYEGAMATYRDVLALYPDNYTALLYLGNYCRDNGKAADALHYLRRAQALKPTPYVDECISRLDAGAERK